MWAVSIKGGVTNVGWVNQRGCDQCGLGQSKGCDQCGLGQSKGV